MVGDARPRPPLNLKGEVVGCGCGGVERKTGNTCMNALLWRGSSAKESMVRRTVGV